MKRREFLRLSGLGTGALFTSPWLSALNIEPSKVKHVVVSMLAGGVRSLEAVEEKEGSLMPHIFGNNIAISSDIREGIHGMPLLSSTPLVQRGVLFKNFKYKKGVTLHYTAHAACIMGRYENEVPLLKPLPYPSMFELFRKHSSMGNNPLSAWWVSDQGGSFPFLYSSSYKGYGAQYAATMVQPYNLFKSNVSFELPQFKQEALDLIGGGTGAYQSQTNDTKLNSFFNNFEDKFKRDKGDIWQLKEKVNNDIYNAYFTSEVLKNFKPRLTVFNMQETDIGHSNFTAYCNNLNKADFATYKIWETIQNDPELKQNTVMIVVPEFGRNKEGNTLVDAFGRRAVDHTGDELSRKLFCLVLGPDHLINKGTIIEEEGELIDIMPTVADLLGFYNNIPNELIQGRVLREIYKV
jgi:hypothetical protein